MLKVVLGYDGTDFHGWQVQPGNVRTVQGEILRVLERLIPVDGIPPGAGRTDAGVHASGQVTSFGVPSPEHEQRVRRALPRMVPPDVVIRSVERVPSDFHARFSATGRLYRYRFMESPDPLLRRHHLLVKPGLDHEAMARACAELIGDHDCTSFCRSSSLEEGRTLCRIEHASVEFEGGRGVFEIRADRFLHSMVRILVGTLLEIGRGHRPVDDFARLIAVRDRRQSGKTAPPHGLSLEQVFYEGSLAQDDDPGRTASRGVKEQ